MQLGFRVAVAVGRMAAAALIRSLAWRFPYAIDAALKKIKMTESISSKHD